MNIKKSSGALFIIMISGQPLTAATWTRFEKLQAIVLGVTCVHPFAQPYINKIPRCFQSPEERAKKAFMLYNESSEALLIEERRRKNLDSLDHILATIAPEGQTEIRAFIVQLQAAQSATDKEQLEKQCNAKLTTWLDHAKTHNKEACDRLEAERTAKSAAITALRISTNHLLQRYTALSAKTSAVSKTTGAPAQPATPEPTTALKPIS